MKTIKEQAKELIDDKGCVIVNPLTKEYTYDDITHALAYGYGARRDGLSHVQALINYKIANKI